MTSRVLETVRLAEEILTLSRNMCASPCQYVPQLTESAFLALGYLATVDKASVGKVQRHVGVVPAQMSRLVRQLQAEGFLTSNINRRDRRIIDVTITEEGRAAHEQYLEAKLAPIIAALKRLRKTEREQFVRLLRKTASQ